jgi:N-acyl-D-aspartate/D-glutamate deacylase
MADVGRLDLVIRGGTVYDGTGAPGAPADVGVRGDRIVAVGAVVDRGAEELEAGGLAVPPGVIDVHTHDHFAVLQEPAMGLQDPAGRHQRRGRQLRLRRGALRGRPAPLPPPASRR